MAIINEKKQVSPNPLPVLNQNQNLSDQGQDLLDNTNDFIRRNEKPLLGAAIAVVAIVGAFVAYRAYEASQNQEAQKEMFHAIYRFEADSLKQALKGDGNRMGFTEIADSYGSTKSGKLAHYYIGVILLKQGKFAEAADNLEDFSSDDILVQARAYALTGDAYSELKDYDKAAEFYLKAANYKPNRFFTPSYLIKLAGVQEAKKDYAGAAQTYDRIVKNYYESQEAADARKYMARAQALAGK